MFSGHWKSWSEMQRDSAFGGCLLRHPHKLRAHWVDGLWCIACGIPYGYLRNHQIEVFGTLTAPDVDVERESTSSNRPTRVYRKDGRVTMESLDMLSVTFITRVRPISVTMTMEGFSVGSVVEQSFRRRVYAYAYPFHGPWRDDDFHEEP